MATKYKALSRPVNISKQLDLPLSGKRTCYKVLEFAN
jgi:hypothetical protein